MTKALKELLKSSLNYVKKYIYSILNLIFLLLIIIAYFAHNIVNFWVFLGFVLILKIFSMIFRKMKEESSEDIEIPTCPDRLTICSANGEIRVRKDRIQEAIIYLAEIEDFLEKKGKI